MNIIERRKIIKFLEYLLEWEVSPNQKREIEAGITYWKGQK